MDLEEIDFERQKIQASMIIVSSHIQKNTSLLTETAKYYLNDAMEFFGNVKKGLIECLYPGKREINYQILTSIGSDWSDINNAIEPVINTKSRKEMLSRVRKINGIESQLEDMKENPKNFYKRADATELAEICKRIEKIVQPNLVQILD
jgi:hypothetical protein